MKARIKFQKYGSMKFVGHLDVMRYFQKMFRRAGIDNEYTKGFSPHQIMSFAAPLGVGLTSDAEYVDVELRSGEAPEEMLRRINGAMTEGFHAVGFHPLLEREENKKNVTAMSLVASADYLVSLKDGYLVSDRIVSRKEFAKTFLEFLNQQEIVIDKKTKTSEQAVNIKPMITLAAFDEAEYETKRIETLTQELTIAAQAATAANTTTESAAASAANAATAAFAGYGQKPASVADAYETGIRVYLQLDTGSSVNLKPELVMEAFYEFIGQPYEKLAWQVHRLEVYTRSPGSGKLAALDQVER